MNSGVSRALLSARAPFGCEMTNNSACASDTLDSTGVDLTIHLRTERTTILFAGSILFWGVLLWTWPKAKRGATILASPQ